MSKEKLKEKHGKNLQDCNFGVKEFNLHKRKLLIEEAAGANQPTRKRRPPPPPPPSGSGGVIYLDFTGHLQCAPANLTAQQVDEVLQNCITEFAKFNVVVTTDEAVYNAAPATSRMRVIFTESWEWYGQAGGVAFINSFKWGDNTPCFVFTSLLNYNTKWIKEAGVHEPGHTLGLYHHSVFDANGVKTAEYDYGNGVTAPIMGCAYYVPDGGSNWEVGQNAYNQIQDDAAIIAGVVGLK